MNKAKEAAESLLALLAFVAVPLAGLIFTIHLAKKRDDDKKDDDKKDDP